MFEGVDRPVTLEVLAPPQALKKIVVTNIFIKLLIFIEITGLRASIQRY